MENDTCKEYNKKYRETHKEEIKQYRKRYHEVHREQENQRSMRYNEAHIEEIKQRNYESYERKKARNIELGILNQPIPCICLKCGYEWGYVSRGKHNMHCPKCHSKFVEYKDTYNRIFRNKEVE